METSIRQTLARLPRATEMSLRAKKVSPGCGHPGGLDLGVERHSLFDSEVAAGELVQHRLEVFRLDLGEETDLTKVDAEEGHAGAGYSSRGPQERSVATEDHQGSGAGQTSRQRIEVACRRGPMTDPVVFAPAFGTHVEIQGGLFGGVVGERNAVELHIRASSPNLVGPGLRQLGRSAVQGDEAWPVPPSPGRTRGSRQGR